MSVNDSIVDRIVDQRRKINFLADKSWSCYIQVSDAKLLQRSEIKKFIDLLKIRALVPDPEALSDIEPGLRQIRFFNKGDKRHADFIKGKALEAGIELDVKDFTRSGFRAPRGQLEVWIGGL